LVLTLNNVLKLNAPTNGLPVRKTLNAYQPSKTVKPNADQKLHAGLYAYLQKEVKLQLMLEDVPKLIIAYQILSLQLLLPLLLLNNALNNTAGISSLPVKKTPNASPPSKTVKRSA
jgi:hypothetical protein